MSCRRQSLGSTSGCGKIDNNDLMSFEDMVNDYKKHHRHNSTEEIEFFKKLAKENRDAFIDHLAWAKDQNGKRFSHQRRLRHHAMTRAVKALSDKYDKILACKNFEELHNYIKSILKHIDYLGELYKYDTSFRIGAALGMLPEHIYLHAGTKEGAKALGLNLKNKHYVDICDVPKEIQQLKAYEIEDFLCIYKDDMAKLQR